jgi:Tol biopolymer transport system component
VERAADWSPDGLSIACHHEEGGVVGLAVIRVGTSDPPRVLAHAIVGTIPAWSPRGDWIAYRTIDAVRLVSPDGVRQRVLAPGVGAALVWSRDGGTLYTTKRTPVTGLQVIAIDVATGAVRLVSSLGMDVTFGTPTIPGQRFTLALDGNSFLATIVRTRSNLWILDNFAPRRGLLEWFARRP